MFTIKQWKKNRYVVVSVTPSRGRMAVALHNLSDPGKVKVFNRKGEEILSGRIFGGEFIADKDLKVK